MMPFWIAAAVIFCILWLVTAGHGSAESVRADELEKDNRRLDSLNLERDITIANLKLNLNALADALEVHQRLTDALAGRVREQRDVINQKGWAYRHTQTAHDREVEEFRRSMGDSHDAG